MTATSKTVANQQATPDWRPRPLLAVMAWEARRLRASRSTWVMLALAFGLFLLVVWLLWSLRFAGTSGFGDGTTFTVSVTSPEGLVMLLPIFSFLLALILPFVNADGTARDLKQRTHELLMATPVPSWAYIWGRYLACLLVSLGLAALLLAALLLMGYLLAQTQADYPLPQPAAIVSIWAAALVPTTALISSVSFALGTVLPRSSNLVKISMILGWFLIGLVLPSIPVGGSGPVPGWYLTWEPTNIGMTTLLQAPYLHLSIVSANPISADTIVSALTNLEQQMPDLGPFILPHLVWAGLGLAAVGAVALSFNRCSNSTN